MNFIFGLQVNIEVFYKLILSFWLCITRHAQSTKNNKLVYLCSISRKAWGIDVDFLHAGKHKNLQQIDTITLMGMIKHFQSSQNSKLAMSLEYLKIEIRDEVVFFFACR